MTELRTLIKVTTSALLCVAVLGSDVAMAAHRRPRKKTSNRTTSRALKRERTSKEQALRKLQQEIARYEFELKEHEKLEKHSKETIQVYEKKTRQLKAKIASLEQEVADLKGQKSEVDREYHATASTLDTLKSAYAKSSALLYMQGTLNRSNADEILLGAKPSDAERMSYYAEVIGRTHAMNRERLDSAKRSLSESSQELASSIESEHQVIGQQREQANTLEARKAQEAKQLAQIQARQERLRKLLKERTASAKRLEGIIANLVLKEESAKRSTKSRNRNRTHSREPDIVSDRAIGPTPGPHSLQWPCTSHHIVQGYGEHRNAELNTITMNLGIDIASPEGSAVKAAAEGEVALVSSLPSYGTIVVVRHSGGLHTVYADLTGASVRQGTHVHTGQQIGRSGSNEENGAVLHFEVWKGKAKQNPMGWLR